MSGRRDEILRATTEAAQVRDKFPVGERTSFDVVGAITELGVPLMFRPLTGLWGATVTVAGELKGVLVTTKLPLQVQRFTLAHELGHVLLGHLTSLDQTVGFAGRLGPKSRPTEELAADTFASELLAPRGLMLKAAKRHYWTREALSEPGNVYQLALRLGVSFAAACWALNAQGVLTQDAARRLQEQPVKHLKDLLAPPALLTNSWADVWELSESDSGSFVEAGPDDIFAVRLADNASAGYLWELVDQGSHSQILEERTDVPTEYGAPTDRTLLLRFDEPGVHRLTFHHRRPWSQKRIAHIDIAINNYGKEQKGFPRRVRETALSMGAT